MSGLGSAKALAVGSASVFTLAIVLGGLPWQSTFVVLTATAAFWSWRGPAPAGAAQGAIAWFCVTGFDVNEQGELLLTGWADAGRAAFLLLTGLAAAYAAGGGTFRPGASTLAPGGID